MIQEALLPLDTEFSALRILLYFSIYLIQTMNVVDIVVLVGLLVAVSVFGLFTALRGTKQTSAAQILHGSKFVLLFILIKDMKSALHMFQQNSGWKIRQ